MKAVVALALLVVLQVSVTDASSSYALTIGTNRPFYLVGETMNVYGQLSYNGWPIQSQLIAVQIQNPWAETIFLCTITTDSEGRYSVSFKLPPEAQVGTYTALANHNAVANRTVFNVVEFLGDVNADGVVDLKDVFAVAKAYNSYPGHPSWNPLCDLNFDGKVDLKDYFTTIENYGKGTR